MERGSGKSQPKSGAGSGAGIARRGSRIRLLALVALLASAPAARAEDAAAESEPAPSVGLDQLLRLPSSSAVHAPAGDRPPAVSRDQWRQRYQLAKGELEEEQKKLEAAQDELQELAGGTSNWQMSAPGGATGGSNGPISFRLRQEIRHSREEIDRLERRLRDVLIEAELAGVPREWLVDESDTREGPALGSGR